MQILYSNDKTLCISSTRQTYTHHCVIIPHSVFFHFFSGNSWTSYVLWNRSQNHPKMVPQTSQDRPEIVPKWLRNRPPRKTRNFDEFWTSKNPPKSDSWGHLGPSWPHLGPILAPSWPILAHLGPFLAPSWPILAPSWPLLGPSWPIWPPSLAFLAPSSPFFSIFLRFLLIFNFQSILRSNFYWFWMDFAAPEKQKIIDFILVFVVFFENRRFQINMKN